MGRKLRSRGDAEYFGPTSCGKGLAVYPFVAFSNQSSDHFTLGSNGFDEISDVRFIPCNIHGGVGTVFHVSMVLALNR